MIRVIDITSKHRTPISEGHVSYLLRPSEDGTRVEVAIREVDPGKTCRIAPSNKTQVAYVLEGRDVKVTHSIATTVTNHPASRRSGVYLEPGEEASLTASATELRLLLVTVSRHAGKPVSASAPNAGYYFEEAQLQSLIDERAFRERTFWVNKEIGLSGSWDLQLGRMRYLPHAHSPRHVHHPSPTSAVTPEHFYFIEDGVGEVKHDTGSLPIRAGQLVFIPAGEWHQLVASDTGLDYIEFQAPFDFTTSMDHDPLGKNWYIKGTDDGTGKPELWVQS